MANENWHDRLRIIEKSAKQVGPGVFFSTLIVITSFLPVFLLTGQEGKLFSPLAWTKTFILLVDAFLAITFVPVLIFFFLRGKLRPQSSNPITVRLEKVYTPVLKWCMRHRKTTLIANILALLLGVGIFTQLGSEFMPPLDEGTLLFMPVTLPDVSRAEAKRILQIQDRIIRSVPEVENVLGKAGRANTATDNAPLSMSEIIILLKPKSEWRSGLTTKMLIDELNKKVQIPGVTNGWTQPIINRINMLSTGIRTDVGIKVYSQKLDSIYPVSRRIESLLKKLDGVQDVYVEQITGGKYLDIQVKKSELSRYGLSVDDVNMLVESALGGSNITQTVEGRQRFGVSIRLAQDYRGNLNELKRLPLVTDKYGSIPLSMVADIRFQEGPPMINSENAMLLGTVQFNVRGRDLGSTVNEAIKKLNASLKLPAGTQIEWSGQWENQIRAERTLLIIIPIVLFIIFVILFLTYHSLKEALLTLITVPFALVGGIYMVFLYQANLSVAVAVGFIALFGVAIETAMLMNIYLNEYMRRLAHDKGNSANSISKNDLREYIIMGAVKRLRPVIMTVSVSLFGLIPVLWAKGTGSDVMLPITIPLIGGVITSTIYVLLVTPVIQEMVRERELKKHGKLILANEETA